MRICLTNNRVVYDNIIRASGQSAAVMYVGELL